MAADQLAITTWIALFDRADDLHRTLPGSDPTTRRQVDTAIRALWSYEHTLSPDQRRRARERLWRRDQDEPLPTDRDRWTQCGCHRCQLARVVANHLPAQPVSSAVVPVTTDPHAEQGALPPC